MKKKTAVWVLVSALMLLLTLSVSAGAASVRLQTSALDQNGLYLAVWNYALPTLGDVIGKKPLLQLTLQSDFGAPVNVKIKVSAAFNNSDRSSTWGWASGWADFQPIVVQPGKNVYKVDTDTLTLDDLTSLITSDDMGSQLENYMGDFKDWQVNNSDYDYSVDENKIIERLVRFQFPPGFYELKVEAWYQAPGSLLWTEIPAENHSFRVVDTIGAVELVGPAQGQPAGQSPLFRWRAPALPEQVAAYDVLLTVTHGGKVIWAPVLHRTSANAGKEDSIAFNSDKTANEVLVGGEDYDWNVALIGTGHTNPNNVILPGREFSKSATWSFALANTAPKAQIVTKTESVKEGSQFTFMGQYSDADDEQLKRIPQRQWIVNGKAGALITTGTPGHGSDELALTFASAGTYTITYQVKDAYGDVAIDVATVNVTKNAPPAVTLLSPAAGNYEVGTKLALQAEVTDVDSSAVTVVISVNGTNLLSQELSGSGRVGPARTDQVELTLAAAGTYKIGVTAKDNAGGQSVQTLEVKSFRLAAPQITITSPTAGRTVVLGDTIMLQANAVDEKGQVYPVTWFAGATQLTQTQTSAYPIVLERTSFRATAERSTAEGLKKSEARIDVVAVPNQAPAVKISDVATGLTVGQTVNLSATATDPEQDLVELQWTATGPDGKQASLGSGNSVALQLAMPGMYTVTATATDIGRATAFRKSTSATVSVLATQPVAQNKPPVVKITSPINNARFDSGQNITISAAASDPDNDNLEIIWRLAGMDIGTGASLSQALPILPVGTQVNAEGYANMLLQVTVSDLKGGMVQDKVTIQVKPVPKPQPVITIATGTAGPPSAYVVGESVALAASEKDGMAVTYRWLIGQNEVATGATYTLALTKPGLQAITLEATNAYNVSGHTVVTIEVTANQPPELAIAGDATISVEQGKELTLQATVTDAENKYGNVEWAIDGKPVLVEWLSDDAVKHTTLRFPINVQGVPTKDTGSYLVTAKVTDNMGQIAGDTKTIIVFKPVPTPDKPNDPKAPPAPEPKQNESPAVQIEKPRAGGIEPIIAEEDIALLAQVSDAEAGKIKVMWLVNGVPGPVAEAQVPAGNKQVAVNGTLRFAAAGRYALVVRVVDEAGAQAETAVTVTVEPRPGAEETEAVIVRPLANSFVMVDDELEFLAENVPGGASISWESDKVGIIGNEEQFRRTLPEGLHTITLNVNGQFADSRQVTVVGQIETRSIIGTIYKGSSSCSIKRATGTERMQNNQVYDLLEGETLICDRGVVELMLRDGSTIRTAFYPILAVGNGGAD